MTAGKELTNDGDVAGAWSDPPGPAFEPAGSALRSLSPGECFDLLEPGGIGRVGFVSAAGITMLPVNFAVTGKAIVFRTAPDTLLALHADVQVGFQVDRFDEARHEGWSVLVRGHARTVTDEHEVRQLERRTHLRPWAAGARDVYVRIRPAGISGRRLQPG
jgi:nitroimidazol reductase NimA-like FMN-containing flavoprotein (pyridoxamine 5'-phosphate oxidase superfamily)